jgi:GT2 family glycosyltransferase
MKLSIIVLTWNSERFIVRCIEALKSTVTTKPLEWIVVDNGSGDSTLQLVKKLLPEANIIHNKANLGVARARNQGIIASSGEYVLILDDDTQTLPDAVDLLCDYLNQHPKCALVAPQLVNPDGSIQANALPFPSVKEKSLRIVKKILGIPLQNQYSESIEAKLPFQPGYLIGACQLIRRKAITATGLLDERMFYGPEDADYCLRLKKHGFEVICLPSVSVIHAYQRQSYNLKKPGLLWAHFKGLVYFWRKHYPGSL